MDVIETGKLLFAKFRPQAIIPSKRPEDAGYDVYACFSEPFVQIAPGQIVLIPTGIASAFDKRYALIAKERGSTGSKGMSVRMGVIDSGYRGEIVIGINNTSDKHIVIAKEDVSDLPENAVVYPYTKAIAQLILIALPEHQCAEVSYEDLCSYGSSRGEGNLGSSGK